MAWKAPKIDLPWLPRAGGPAICLGYLSKADASFGRLAGSGTQNGLRASTAANVKQFTSPLRGLR